MRHHAPAGSRLGVVGLLNLHSPSGRAHLGDRGEPASLADGSVRSKAIGVSLARIATLMLAGRTLLDMGADQVLPADRTITAPAVRQREAAVLPFGRFPGVDAILGPEMKSTGEVVGIDADSGWALAKAFTAAGRAAERGTVFVSVANRDKRAMFPAKRLADLGFDCWPRCAAGVLHRAGIGRARWPR
jgi:carbamoyl-phosphate synthase large subunit